MGIAKFFKKLLLVFDKFRFLNFVTINVERFAGINFAIAVTETYFLYQVLSFRLRKCWSFFSEIFVSLINCDIAF